MASKKLYGGSLNQFANSFPRAFGWKVTFVDPDDPENFRKAITPRTKALFIESLANPGGVVCDIRAIADVADAAGIPLIVDNTMATPYLCRPIEHGATLVVHSTTKFLSGHGNSVGGIVIDSGKFDWRNGKFPALSEPEPGYHGLRFADTFGHLAFTIHGHAIGLRDLGPSMAPLNAFLTIAGVETLALRMERHCANAKAVAEFLKGHPAVAWVNYAGLPDSPYHALAKRYLPNGAGAVFTFGLKGGYEEGVRMVESVELFSHLANIGDTRSLIIHPASTTHRQLSPEGLKAAGATPDVIRISVGLESVDDIIADLDRALNKLG
ncbi:O-acetylhomoserine aminocarboxypropyltransferase/cysteine synthase family protein [Aerophototrophica crusticola]|uniref:O-acetylhomoserine aminocarboxypropyltransferase/cysteine synthase family protein n=1 Tax=Aerophototrophica crusticola TaxID=1709002 RepID=UPI00384BD6C7